MNDAYDVLLVGAGLANGLIALRLKQRDPTLRIGLLDSDTRIGGNHTWSFHGPDLNADQHAWIAPLVGHRWDGYDVRFPDLARTFASSYLTITSERFAEHVARTLGADVLLGVRAQALTADSVTLSDGRVLKAPLVIDGRGPAREDAMVLGYQTFLGQEWQLRKPHGLTRPIVMDATVAQGEGYRFVYVLPLAPDRLLVEDTHYVDTCTLPDATLRSHIADYMRERDWQAAALCREERGALPIVLAGELDRMLEAFGSVPRAGLRAALFHQTTGYSLPHAMAWAETVGALDVLTSERLQPVLAEHLRQTWSRQGFFRLLNRMLFLAGRPDARWRVMQRFYGLPAPLIERFYAARLTPLDRLRILMGKPPVPVGAAMRAARRTHPSHYRTPHDHGT